MADDVTLNATTVPGGKVVAAEDIGGKQVQRVKLVIGAAGVDGGDVASGNPVPVAGAVTVSGVATAAAQATAQTALDAIKAAVEAAATQITLEAVRVLLAAIDGKLPALVGGRLDAVIGAALPAGTNTIGATKVDSSNVDTYHAGTITSGAATSVRTAACRVYHVEWTNATGATAMIGLYDKASAPVVGTDFPRCEVIATNNNPASRDLGTHGFKFNNGVQVVVYTTARTPTPVASVNATFTLALDP